MAYAWKIIALHPVLQQPQHIARLTHTHRRHITTDTPRWLGERGYTHLHTNEGSLVFRQGRAGQTITHLIDTSIERRSALTFRTAAEHFEVAQQRCNHAATAPTRLSRHAAHNSGIDHRVSQLHSLQPPVSHADIQQDAHRLIQRFHSEHQASHASILQRMCSLTSVKLALNTANHPHRRDHADHAKNPAHLDASRRKT
ncbi:hypothetical protein AF72_04155 [Xylella taiwanensis]|uniref:Uncharacterized protein n=1 Tax=Xylella taiwanensis TaxID=1444770 RepID=Z9JK25_9GAMM|nr:hypothetical protein AF72_04155 [Xylella taiwanensis]